MTSRRTVLRAGAALAAAAGPVAGCGGGDAGLEVFVTWSGPELSAFRRTLVDFTAQTGRRVRVVPVGEQLTELVRARLDTGNPPDLAIGPVPGLIRQYAAQQRVAVLGAGVGRDTPEDLRRLVTLDTGAVVGLWVKAADKSLFWHRPATFQPGTVPTTWAELVDWARAAARIGRVPLAIGAADGWVLTDWFENALLGGGGGDVYRDLAAGRPVWDSPLVTGALTRLADLWSIPEAFPGGPERALLTQYEESVVQVFATRTAQVVFEGDFVTNVTDRFARGDAAPPDFFTFPPDRAGVTPPLLVGGDVAALLSDTDAGRELIAWLDRPESMGPWIDRGGFLSPNLAVPPDRYRSAVARRIAERFHQQAGQARFDLSDQAVGRLGGGPGRGLWRILQEFFRAVTGPAAGRATAVRNTQRELIAASLPEAR